MEILREEDVQSFCSSDDVAQDGRLSASVSARRPSHVLPVFQLCAAVHAAARGGRLDFVRFRACWDRFVVQQFVESGAGGYVVHVGDGDVEEENPALAVLELPRPEMPRRDSGRGDARDWREDVKELILRQRFAALHERAHPRLELRHRVDPGSWRRLCKPPDTLAGATYAERHVSKTILDNNVFVELLNVLPAEGSLEEPPTLPSRYDAVAKRIHQAFTVDLYEDPGRLIVPMSVLIEAEGVTWMKPEEYENARAVLKAMARNPSGILWKVFDFDDLNLEIFDAFLHLYERLDKTLVPRDHWPRLGDALVFSHGLVHGCPIASGEWTDAGNIHWRQAGINGLFPFLELS